MYATPAYDALIEASNTGTVLMGESAGAIIWGVGFHSNNVTGDNPAPVPMFGWLADLAVLAHYSPDHPARLIAMGELPGAKRGLGIASHEAVVAYSSDDVSLLAPADDPKSVLLTDEGLRPLQRRPVCSAG